MRPFALEKIPAPVTRARPKFAAKFAAIAEDEEEAQVIAAPSKPLTISTTTAQITETEPEAEPVGVTPVVQVCIESPEQDQSIASLENVSADKSVQAQPTLNSPVLAESEPEPHTIEMTEVIPVPCEPVQNRSSSRGHARTSSFGQLNFIAQATRFQDTSDCKSGLATVSVDGLSKPALIVSKSPRASLWVPAQPSRLRCGSFDKINVDNELEHLTLSAGTSPALSARSSECDFSASRCITPSIDSDSDLAFGSRMHSHESAMSAVAHAPSAFARIDDMPSGRLRLAQRQRLSDFDIQTGDSVRLTIPTNHSSLAAPEVLTRQRSHSHGSLRREVLLSGRQANHSAV